MHMRAVGINPAIFRAYDIRGIYPDEIDERAAYLIARAFARQVRVMRGLAPRLVRRSPRLAEAVGEAQVGEGGSFSEVGESNQKQFHILVSSDARPSSPSLKEAFLRGLLEEGASVIDAGLTTTPMHAFVVHWIGADGGAMITASHNPANFNGVKLIGPRGAIGEGSGMEEVAQMATRGIFEEGGQKGSVREENFLPAYISFFVDYFSALREPHAFGERPLRIALDSGDGMTGILLSPLFGQFPSLEPIIVHEGIDMSFPHHEANPIKQETLRDLQEAVTKNQCDLGAAFDGDGDRLGVINEKSEILPPDLLTALFAREAVKQRQGSTIIFDEARTSRVVREEVEWYGGRAVACRIGHTFFKNCMRKENAVFGGELSGHYYFQDFFFVDSAIFALFNLLRILNKERKSLHELTAPLFRYAKPSEINFKLKEGTNKDMAIDYIASCFADGSISYPDGIKVLYRDWWFNVRPSNTEPLIRLNIEADTKELLEAKKRIVWECIKKYTI